MDDLAQTVYNVEWAADPCVGEAITNILCDELKRRGIRFELGFAESTMGDVALVPEYKPDRPEIYRCVTVEEEFGEQAQEVLNSIFLNRTQELKSEAVRIAKMKGIVLTDQQVKEYGKALAESFGW